MITANCYVVRMFLNGITGLADVDSEVLKYQYLDPNNEEQVKEIIRKELKPEFDARNSKAKERMKFCLSYYLTKPTTRFDELFDYDLVPFNSPDDPRMFYVWIWEEYFPGEDYIMEEYQSVKEVSDIYEPNRYGPAMQ